MEDLVGKVMEWAGESSVSGGCAPPPPRNGERLASAADPQENNRVQLRSPRSGRRGALSSQGALPGEPGGWVSGDLAHPTFRTKCSADTQKAPMEGDGDPRARAPLPTLLQAQAAGDKCPFSLSQRPHHHLDLPGSAPGLRRGRRAPTRPDTASEVGSRDRGSGEEALGQGQSLAGTRDRNVPPTACPELVNLANTGFRGDKRWTCKVVPGRAQGQERVPAQASAPKHAGLRWVDRAR